MKPTVVLKTYHCYAEVTGSKYLGTVEAANPDEAEEKAQELASTHISLCHHCSHEVEDAQVDSIKVELHE